PRRPPSSTPFPYTTLFRSQDVDKVPDLDGLLRSHIQHHGQVASYVFAGSEPALMRQLFENKDRPLYGSAVPMRLGRLPDDAVARSEEHTSELQSLAYLVCR